MSVKVMGLAWYVQGLTPAQKVVLVALADHANDDGRSIYPSVNRLVQKTSLSERAVRRALADLREKNLIHVSRFSKYHQPTEYFLDLPEMQVSQNRPATDAPHDLPESPEDLPEMPERPARDAPKPSFNHQEPSESSTVWEKVLFTLRDELRKNKPRIVASISQSVQISLEESANQEPHVLQVMVPDEFTRQWCEERLAKKAARIAAGFLAHPVEIWFVVADE